jgi:hypothetical protein
VPGAEPMLEVQARIVSYIRIFCAAVNQGGGYFGGTPTRLSRRCCIFSGGHRLQCLDISLPPSVAVVVGGEPRLLFINETLSSERAGG